MKNTRYSKQRNRILEILKNTSTHPTASWIYNELVEEFPDLSLGTVYRNLNVLVEQGLVKRIDFGSTFDRFEVCKQPHYHFVCEKCNSVIDLNVAVDDTLNNKVERETGIVPNSHRIEFFGICDRCKT